MCSRVCLLQGSKDKSWSEHRASFNRAGLGFHIIFLLLTTYPPPSPTPGTSRVFCPLALWPLTHFIKQLMAMGLQTKVISVESIAFLPHHGGQVAELTWTILGFFIASFQHFSTVWASGKHEPFFLQFYNHRVGLDESCPTLMCFPPCESRDLWRARLTSASIFGVQYYFFAVYLLAVSPNGMSTECQKSPYIAQYQELGLWKIDDIVTWGSLLSRQLWWH